MRPGTVISGNDHTGAAFPGMAGVKVERTTKEEPMPYIDIHNERVWIPARPLRSMEEARPMRDGDLWRCPSCGRELDREENDDGTITLVCPSHQIGWDAGHEDEPYPMGGLVFRPTMGGGVLITGPCLAVCLDRTSAVNAFFALGGMYGLTRIEGVRP